MPGRIVDHGVIGDLRLTAPVGGNGATAREGVVALGPAASR
ncbi:hypothetical protein GCM10017691_10930 [Pseudonocardia petroleophila]|nr:hypothetical protein [Pseudonocardia petroleophila]